MLKSIDIIKSLGSQSVVCRKEELLISGLQPQKGKILIVDESTEGCIASSEFFPFKVTSNIITPEYLKIISRSDVVSKQWEYQITGCTPSRARIGVNNILDTLIPIIDNIDRLVNDINRIKKNAIEYRNQAHQEGKNARKGYVINLVGEKYYNNLRDEFLNEV